LGFFRVFLGLFEVFLGLFGVFLGVFLGYFVNEFPLDSIPSQVRFRIFDFVRASRPEKALDGRSAGVEWSFDQETSTRAGSAWVSFGCKPLILIELKGRDCGRGLAHNFGREL
jgi:hypothetical protein